jgi:hypothetical protein
MTSRRNPAPGAPPATSAAEARPGRIIDDGWNEQVQGVLRRAAESRNDRDRIRSIEDARSTQRETEALMALIDGHTAPGDR